MCCYDSIFTILLAINGKISVSIEFGLYILSFITIDANLFIHLIRDVVG